MPGSATRTASQTTPYTSVIHITRKAQADLLAIGDTYQYFTEEYAQNVIHDVRILIDEEVIDRVQFIWTKQGTNLVLDALRYIVVNGQAGLADDRPGGIQYDAALATADFHVRVTYNNRWLSVMHSIQPNLALTWGSAGNLNYSNGRWVADRTYSMDGRGLVRNRFIR
jgi:Bacterial HORMA domain family 1